MCGAVFTFLTLNAKRAGKKVAKASGLDVPRLWWVWLTAQLLVVTWDLGYILLRPRTLPGGDLAFIYKPYVLYSTIDLVYGVRDGEFNAFGIGQSLMNVLENVAYLIGLWLYRVRRDKNFAFVVWFGALVATFSKTVLYALVEIGDQNRNVSHNDWTTFFFLYILPNNVWTVVPGIFIFVVFGPQLVRHLNSIKSVRAVREEEEEVEAVVLVEEPPAKATSGRRGRASRSPRRKQT